ncbi:hypothetical protein L1987_31970 [Smallanthus sonchifolius]|uniref:Uncharacterized protein n=1 Tax=Smallanthus sonchifolius TaxID=185202 RepID=A0ACB9I8A8_9ASTR|nr:hypothetical protein L1987_31970 [Smallanthus sonchifolius]
MANVRRLAWEKEWKVMMTQHPKERTDPLPDLNSILSSSSLAEPEKLISDEVVPNTCEQLDAEMGNRSDHSCAPEVEATLNMGKELGVNLANLDVLVRSVIEGEMVTNMVQ